MIEPGTLGGILLILGAFALYKGKVMWSVILYGIADLMWLWLALISGDTLGAIMIGVGLALGIGVYIKMNTGIFRKDLHI